MQNRARAGESIKGHLSASLRISRLFLTLGASAAAAGAVTGAAAAMIGGAGADGSSGDASTGFTSAAASITSPPVICRCRLARGSDDSAAV